MIRALLVDDEPAALRGLRALLEPHGDVAIVGECRNGLEARAAFEALEPTLVFLDVKMPDLDGFGALATSHRTPPAVVFVTAFEEHARRAFDVQAVDYLLKPFDRRRFEVALDRARQRIAAREDNHHAGRLLIRDGRGLLNVNLADVSHVEARGNYVRVHTSSGMHLHREPIHQLAKRASQFGLLQVSRTTLVNVAHVVELRPTDDGRYQIRLRSGVSLTSSRRMSREMRRKVERQ